MNNSRLHFYQQAVKEAPNKTKTCYPKEKDGCGCVKPVTEFICREKLRSDGSYRYAYDGWCKKCQNARSRQNYKRSYQHKKLPDPRYQWDANKKTFRVIYGGSYVGSYQSEDRAAATVIDLQNRDEMFKRFFTMPAPPLIWDVDLQDMVPR